MPNTAAGYVADTPENVYVTSKGRAPLEWWGTTIPDGDATPWASAPVGSRYMYKADESTLPAFYIKVATTETDDDWAVLQYARIFSGQPMGLLLALTHK